jgi:hypothetical protein
VTPPFRVVAASPADLLPVFAALYGAPAEEMTWLADTLQAAWAVLDEDNAVRGAAGVRPSPAHGLELMGGALAAEPEEEQAVQTALAKAAHRDAGQVYAFADGSLFTAQALAQAGFQEVGAYRLLAGPTPEEGPPTLEGFTLRPLADVPDLAIRLDALTTYEDRIGHHAVSPTAAEDGAGGYDSTLSLIALDAQGRAAGICRAAAEEGYIRIDAPGVRADLRHTPLRQALLLGVCAQARARGIGDISLESWGDTPAELAADLALGLEIQFENPIYAAG